ncbi:MAG: hypothetical protein VKN33_08240 [Candidatus Sericytochromatia bacterium]|nr:hypothetical protein [Candidatus Sericytochromatia bacterium]
MAGARLFATCLTLCLLSTSTAAWAADSAPAKQPTPYPSAWSGEQPVELIETVEEGVTINWTTSHLLVSGVGAPGDRGSTAYKRTLSSRLAKQDAYRRLASAIPLLRVDANTRVKDLSLLNPALRDRLQQQLKTAEVLETNSWPDGSTELVLRLSLRGTDGLQSLIGSEPPQEDAQATDANTDETTDTTLPRTTAQRLLATYSALIIDARGLGAQPSLLPGIRDKDEKVVDFTPHATKFLREGADTDTLAGVNPLLVRAQRTEGALRADFVLNPEASERVKTALRDRKLGPSAALIVVL